MSNTNTPFGFRHLGTSLGASSYTGALVNARIAYNYSSAIYPGDPVIEDGAGNIIRASNGLARPILGIFVGCDYLSTTLGRKVWADTWPGSDVASTEWGNARIIPISGAPSQLFAVQSYSTACTRAYIGLNVDIIYTAGSVVGGHGKSACSVDIANAATTNTFPFRLRGLYSEIAEPGVNGTDDTASYNIVLVSSNIANDLGYA